MSSVVSKRKGWSLATGISALVGLFISAVVLLVPAGSASAATACYPPGTVCANAITVTSPVPKVTGTVKVNATIKVTPKFTAKVAVAGKKATIKYTYQWLKNGKSIKGATKATYKVPKGTKKGTKFSVKIVGTVSVGTIKKIVTKTTTAVKSK